MQRLRHSQNHSTTIKSSSIDKGESLGLSKNLSSALLVQNSQMPMQNNQLLVKNSQILIPNN